MSLRQTLLAISLLTAGIAAHAESNELLNVSYDPTRELYTAYNESFSKYWESKTHQKVNFKQSHAGSGAQARAVIDGLGADVVTLALAADIDAIADKTDLLPKNWQARLPDNSTPYTSTIVFLVRKGNPKNIHDWSDVVKPGVEIVTPNPKTSGGARWNYLAAWGWAKQQPGGNDTTAKAFVQQIYAHTKVLDSGARGSTTTFVERGQGDVLLAWENEAYLAVREAGDKFEIITPSKSILAEPPVALVDKNVDKHGTRSLATGYLNYLYSPAGQDIAAKNFYRPRNKEIAAKYSKQFAPVKLFTIDKEFGGWTVVQKTHFADGGVFDQIITANNAAK